MKGYIKLYIIVSAILITLAASLFIYTFASDIGTNRAAKAILKSELIQLKKDNIDLSKNNKNLTKKINACEDDIKKLTQTDEEFKNSIKSLEDYQAKITKLKEEFSKINTPSILNDKYSEKIKNASNAEIGTEKKYTDTTLEVGKDISPARYKIKGNGSFRTVNKNNVVTESQNIGILESDSYTAILSQDTKLTIMGTLTFVEVN